MILTFPIIKGGFIMLKGFCPKCGFVCYGWVLRNPSHQNCRECGTRLEIREPNGDSNKRKTLEVDMKDKIVLDK